MTSRAWCKGNTRVEDLAFNTVNKLETMTSKMLTEVMTTKPSIVLVQPGIARIETNF